MRVKIFSVPSSNRRPRLDELEHEVNRWLGDNPELDVVSSTLISQPGFGWGHTALAVWVDERSGGE